MFIDDFESFFLLILDLDRPDNPGGHPRQGVINCFYRGGHDIHCGPTSLFEKLSICDVMKIMLLRIEFKNAVAG